MGLPGLRLSQKILATPEFYSLYSCLDFKIVPIIVYTRQFHDLKKSLKTVALLPHLGPNIFRLFFTVQIQLFNLTLPHLAKPSLGS
jgi:hypothetical protein